VFCRLCVLRRGTVRLLRSSALARWARLSGGASSILAGRSDGAPTRARWPGLMNAPSIHSVSAAAGALRRLESVWMHRSACWAGYPSDSSRRLTAVGASHTSSIATAQGLKDYDYADDVDCHHRHRAPAAAAVGPVPPRLRTSAEVGHAPARAGGRSPEWGAGLPPVADLGGPPARDRPGPPEPLLAPSGLHDHCDCRPGRGSLRPDRRRSHHTDCRRPRRAVYATTTRAGGRRSGRTLIAGVVISPCDGRGPRGLCDCLPGGGRRSGRT
jgi:hypothetical protein